MPTLNLVASYVLSVINLVFLLAVTHHQLPLWKAVEFELGRGAALLLTGFTIYKSAAPMLDFSRDLNAPTNIRSLKDVEQATNTVARKVGPRKGRKALRLAEQERNAHMEDLEDSVTWLLWPVSLTAVLPTVALYIMDDVSKR